MKVTLIHQSKMVLPRLTCTFSCSSTVLLVSAATNASDPMVPSSLYIVTYSPAVPCACFSSSSLARLSLILSLGHIPQLSLHHFSCVSCWLPNGQQLPYSYPTCLPSIPSWAYTASPKVLVQNAPTQAPSLLSLSPSLLLLQLTPSPYATQMANLKVCDEPYPSH
jgi:hypothetical protein